MSKKSKSKRNPQKGRDAVQPNNGRERITISKVQGELEEKN
ncbi:hypothetical protein RJD24_20740 [Bacillaceae bacterium IKA-2]|nr:hypothetical protein RJD24_20740 [Bacillaceae bacterium IKA-2]